MGPMNSIRTFAFVAAASLLSGLTSAQTVPIRIAADLTDAPRRIYRAEIDLPVTPGPAAFTTPEWIPGNHRPTGPVADITGVVFSIDGKPIPWRRDDVDMYEFHVDVPRGAHTLHVHLDCIRTTRLSAKMAMLEWEDLMLYPANTPVASIAIQPSVKVLPGWGVGTALTPVHAYDPNSKPGGTIAFEPTTVEQLEDSPVIAGEYFHEYALAPDITPKHYIDDVADMPADAALRPELLDELNNLVHQASLAYGSHHYNEYHFLLTLSNAAGGEGLEHGQSSDNGVGEKGFTDAKHQIGNADLLAHEFTHSWNGKYRRPWNLYQPDFHIAEQGELLWVYEGMTQYMGNVLAARTGLETAQQYRDKLAASFASLDYKPGRLWRTTDDTAIAASVLRANDPAWSNWRRSQDYYQEGELMWLDADTLIRQQTHGAKSLTDFFHLFLAKGGDTGPLIVPYHRQELIDDLNQVMPYDWAGFLHQRIDLINDRADEAGIERGGYHVVYVDHASETEKEIATARDDKSLNFWYSLGLRMSEDGVISDVRVGSAADKAGLAPHDKVIAIDGQVFTKDTLHDALVDGKTSATTMHLIVQNDGFVSTADVDYHGGERYPEMQRVDGTPGLLDQVIAPLTARQ
jgi:predicted metalloprotease with PDZ domain